LGPCYFGPRLLQDPSRERSRRGLVDPAPAAATRRHSRRASGAAMEVPHDEVTKPSPRPGAGAAIPTILLAPPADPVDADLVQDFPLALSALARPASRRHGRGRFSAHGPAGDLPVQPVPHKEGEAAPGPGKQASPQNVG